jgi:hypothetical protein
MPPFLFLSVVLRNVFHTFGRAFWIRETAPEKRKTCQKDRSSEIRNLEP